MNNLLNLDKIIGIRKFVLNIKRISSLKSQRTLSDTCSIYNIKQKHSYQNGYSEKKNKGFVLVMNEIEFQ